MARPRSPHAPLLREFREALVSGGWSSSTATNYSAAVGALINKLPRGLDDAEGLATILNIVLSSKDRYSVITATAWRHFSRFMAHRGTPVTLKALGSLENGAALGVQPLTESELGVNTTPTKATGANWMPLDDVSFIVAALSRRGIASRSITRLLWANVRSLHNNQTVQITGHTQAGASVTYTLDPSEYAALKRLFEWSFPPGSGLAPTAISPVFPRSRGAVESISHNGLTKRLAAYHQARNSEPVAPALVPQAPLSMEAGLAQIVQQQADQRVAEEKARREAAEASRRAEREAKARDLRRRVAAQLDYELQSSVIHNRAEREANAARLHGGPVVRDAGEVAVLKAGLMPQTFTYDEQEEARRIAQEELIPQRDQQGIPHPEKKLYVNAYDGSFPETPEESLEKLKSMGAPAAAAGDSNESSMGAAGGAPPVLVFDDTL